MSALLFAALGLFLLVGMSAGRSVKTREDYFVAGRAGSWLSIGGSLLATVVGGSATIGVAGLAYQRGLTGAWWTLSGSVGLMVLGILVAPRVRRLGTYTLPGLAERMYGPRVGMTVAMLTVVAWTGVVSGQLVAAARVLSLSGQGQPTLWLVVFTSVLVIYAVAGGQRAVIRTDVLQAIVILGGMLGTLCYLLRMMGGIGSWAASAPTGFLDFPVGDSFSRSELGAMLVLVGSVYLVGPDIYTRLLSARDEGTARLSALGAAVLVVPVALTVSALGISARILAPGLPAELALPWLISTVLPLPLSFLLLVALLAALMSSADTTLLGQASILSNDVIAKLLPMAESRIVSTAKMGVVLLAALSMVLALSLQGVLSSLMFAYTIFASGVVGPLLVGLLAGRRRPGASSAITGIIVGGSCGLIGALPGLDVPLKGQLAIVGLALSVILPLTLSHLSVRVTTRI